MPYEKAQVSDAPSMEAGGQLSQDEEAELYRHYGLDYSEHRSDSGLPTGERDRDGDGVDDDARTPRSELTPRGRPPTTP